MLHATWKSLLGRKLRLLLSAFSIVLGIAFVSGSLMFTNLLGSSFNSILTSGIADVNVSLAGGPSLDGPGRPVDAVVEPALVDRIAEIDGVSEATGVVSSTSLYPLDKSGKLLAFGGAPGIGSNWFTTPAAGGAEGARIIDGRAPESDDELVIDPATMERGKYAVGDEIEISTPKSGIRDYTIVGTGTFGAGATAGASYLFLTQDEMRTLVFDGDPEFTAVWIATEQGADADRITQEVEKLLPEGLVAISGQEQADLIEEQLSIGLSFVNTFLLVFAAIALVVASLLILNTFSILVAQRSRELALLRALGAKRKQIRDSVLLEAAVIGVVGATIGIAVGYGLTFVIGAALGSFGVDIGTAVPTLTWQSVVVSYVLALVITMVAAWGPARKASATRPVEAMTTAAAQTEPMGTGVHAGFGLIMLGIAGIVCGIFFDVPEPLAWAGIGCVAVLIGCVLAAAVIGAPIVWVFGRMYQALFGEIGKLAVRNATRQPRRTAATASTLMIGLALVTTVTILASSTTTSVRSGLTETQRGDFLISPVNFRPFDKKVADAAAEVDGVEAVWAFSTGGTMLGEEQVSITGATPESVTEGSAIDVLAGQLNAEGGSALVSMDVSREFELPLGRTFELPTLAGTTVELLVTGIFDGESDPSQRGSIIVNTGIFEEVADASLVSLVKIKMAEGADPDTVREGLVEAAADLPTVVVTDNVEYADSLVGQFAQVFAVINALLALAIVISVLGIVNTLGLSVLERTREIGLLRAVGMTRPQLRQVIRLESIIVAVLGSLLGVGLGVLFGIVLVDLLEDSGITELSIGWGQLGLYVVVAAVFGVFAAIAPARRASRMNVLDSIAAE